MKWMKGRKKKKKHTHEREFNQETVLHDWCHGKELYTTRDPNEGVIKKTADCDWNKVYWDVHVRRRQRFQRRLPRFRACVPRSFRAAPKKKSIISRPLNLERVGATHPREERGGRGL